MVQISVVIPVYNAEGCLDELCARLVKCLKSCASSFEIVLIDDCSQDRSWPMIAGHAEADSRIRGVRLSRNFGQHTAICAGLDHCDGDWVMVMDCDLQDAPEDIPRLLEMARRGYDVVLTRRLRRNEGRLRLLFGKLFAAGFEYLTERNYDSRVGAFRILSRRVVEAYRRMDEKIHLLGGAIDWLGFPTASIEIAQNERLAGRSGYNFRKLLRLAAFSVIAYSDKPLRLGVKAGFILSALACLAGLVLIFDQLFGAQKLPGWTSVIVSIYLMGGLMMASVGIVGVYVGRLFELAKNRPPYIISDATGNAGELKFYFAAKTADDTTRDGERKPVTGPEVIRLHGREPLA